MLKPVAHYPDPARTNGVLVMCEVMMPDGVTPHSSNKRATILDYARHAGTGRECGSTKTKNSSAGMARNKEKKGVIAWQV